MYSRSAVATTSAQIAATIHPRAISEAATESDSAPLASSLAGPTPVSWAA
ncbi:Uncharacterised protein [Mycobacterium tuberculosis]|nr:Uncharacterised protein [Mycobacterium tuberculosis]